MPKTEIDYSNTIIYKITCKDPAVKDVYVGHTTNFVQRKHAHKQSCINAKTLNYKCKLYETIRSNGGWNNWTMEIINFFKCRDHYEARIKEQEYFVSLNATLNSIEPLPKPKPMTKSTEVIPENIVIEVNKPKNVKKIFCKHCNIECIKSEWETHILSDGHKTNQTLSGKYVCEKCNFTCSKQSNYDRHISTRKHMIHKDRVTGGSGAGAEGGVKGGDRTFSCATCNFTCTNKCNYIRHTNTKKHKTLQQFGVNKKKYDCQCGAKYKYSSGYYRHVKVCKHKSITQDLPTNRECIQNNNSNDEEGEVTPKMLKLLFETFIRSTQETIQSNRELKEAFLEMAKNQAPHHNTNSHNKNINLVLFLNENYKDAMNLTDFVNNLQISFDDLEKMTEVGYVEAVSEKFISGLKQLYMKQRPIHFTDKARETLYDRENNT
jgi:hypothetical protein